MSVTIRDVARRAGVSISTVSRVLNDAAPVREDKRQLVLEAAETLGYAPNPAALSLLNKSTGGLGALLPYVSGEFFSELLGGLDEAAQAQQRFLIVSTSHRKTDELWKAAQALSKRIDGLVVMAPEIDAAGATALLKADVPVVFLNTRAGERLQADVLNFDNYGGTYALTQHLLDLGHRRIALVRGPAAAWDAEERARGYREAMADAGLDTDGLEFASDYTREAGYAAAADVLAADPRPTAVLAANDYCAFGVLSALHEAGVHVPDEMSLCGFDGLASALYAHPPLTTVHAPVRVLGERAVQYLNERLDKQRGPVAFRHEVLPVDVLVRGSTGPP